jgi:hypothetical protein
MTTLRMVGLSVSSVHTPNHMMPKSACRKRAVPRNRAALCSARLLRDLIGWFGDGARVRR